MFSHSIEAREEVFSENELNCSSLCALSLGGTFRDIKGVPISNMQMYDLYGAVCLGFFLHTLLSLLHLITWKLSV